MKKHPLIFYLLIFAIGFLYMNLAIFNFSWFNAIGWLIGIIGIGAFVALFPVSSLHRLLGLILQVFALFIPIKIYTTLKELQVYSAPRLENIEPLTILGQLFSLVGIMAVSFLIFYWFLRRRWDRI